MPGFLSGNGPNRQRDLVFEQICNLRSGARMTTVHETFPESIQGKNTTHTILSISQLQTGMRSIFFQQFFSQFCLMMTSVF